MSKYLIWCKQRGQYFADNSKFETLEEIRNQLLSYHSMDIEEEDEKLLNGMSLSGILEMFEWEVHDLEENPIEMEELK